MNAAAPEPKAILRRFWRGWLVPHRGRAALALGLAALGALASGGYAKAIEWIIAGFERDPGAMLWTGPALIAALAFGKALVWYGQELLGWDIQIEVENRLSQAMFTRAMRAPLALVRAEAPAALAQRFTLDAALGAGVVRAGLAAALAVLSVLAAFAAMLSINGPLTLAIAAVFALSVWPVAAITRRLRGAARASQEGLARIGAEVTDRLDGLAMIRSYQLEAVMEAAGAERFAALRRLKRGLRRHMARVAPLLELTGGLAIAALLALAAWAMTRGEVGMAEFLGLLTGLGVAVAPARGLGQNVAAIQQGAAALERVFALLDLPGEDTGPAPGPRARGAITFDRVGFSYGAGIPALDDLSFALQPGARVALVGRSGSGKSTVLGLLPRLFEPTAGRILLDGEDTAGLPLAHLRAQFAAVGQEAALLSGTIAGNIAFGRPGASEAEIEAAAKAAHAHDFIAALPQGYETRIGSGGSALSGGEGQRIAIARAILRDAPILLLDEPTSALDAASEAQVTAALRQLTKGRTVLTVAHRLSTVRDADLILVLEGGRLVAQGKHTALLKAGGLYAELCRLQFPGGA
jgi:subfamily B ATP-binding cassette protein MsbA